MSFARLLIIVGVVWVLSGCESPDTARPVRVVASTPTAAALLQPLLPDTVAVLMPAGASPHTYAPRPSDARRAEQALVVHLADALDGWATDLSAAAHLALFPLVPDTLQLRAPTAVAHEAAHRAAKDPHFWTDPRAVAALIAPLADTLCAHGVAPCGPLQQRAAQWQARLDTLHRTWQTALAPVAGQPVLLTRPFFRYFLNRYRIPLAGIVTLRHGVGASPKHLQQLIARAKQLRPCVLFGLPEPPPGAARAVLAAASCQWVRLDPLTGGHERSTYAQLMQHNVQQVRAALGAARRP